MNAAAAEIGSDFILGHEEALAREITDVLYAGDPTLVGRFGDAGRAKCLQDMRYCLEHLAPAVAMDDPTLFARYVRWLTSLLAARGVGSRDVRRSLEATRAVLGRQHLGPDEVAAVRRCLDVGLASLAGLPEP